MKLGKILLITAVITITSLMQAGAQEILTGLQENHIVKKAEKQLGRIMQLQNLAPQQLPFIDDFSKPTDFIPDQKKWQGTSVYINNPYGINPPSIGVATFDAINSKGELYSVGNIYSSPADTLLSQPINLAFPNDSIYLTFYFQAGGYGDLPESRDSLILQFSPDGNSWQTVWRAMASATDSSITEIYNRRDSIMTYLHKTSNIQSHFFKAHVKVDRPEFLTDSFRLRFINHASIAINQFTPGRASNADHWNIDYIFLDKGRTALDTLIKDVGLLVPVTSLSNLYEEMPWSHYNPEAREQMFGNQLAINITYHNLGWGTRNVERQIEITPMFGNGQYLSMYGGAENIHDLETYSHDYAIDYDFYSDTDSADFEIKTYLTTDSDSARTDYRYNDTSVYHQKFYDSYAYDDGTAENGYGLFGVGTAAGKVGVQYLCFASDSLRGVYMYFNRTINNVNEENKFRLTVWADANGIPGEIIYTQSATKPTYSDSLNQFVAYKFTQPVFIGRKTTFYIGWQQTNDDFVNIGFDRNNNHQDKVFYSITNQWQPSVYEGSPMIRPIFSPASRFPANPVLPPEDPTSGNISGVVLAPNPSADFVRMIWEDNEDNTTAKRIEIFDMSGQLVRMETSSSNIINVSNLQAGAYVVRISDGNKVKETKKIIVSR